MIWLCSIKGVATILMTTKLNLRENVCSLKHKLGEDPIMEESLVFNLLSCFKLLHILVIFYDRDKKNALESLHQSLTLHLTLYLLTVY